jgi:ribokinase
LTRPGPIVVMGVFMADIVFEAERLPALGETLLTASCRIGPGGKGSNQAVAAARAGGNVAILARLGDDAFGRLARETWCQAGVDPSAVRVDPRRATGAASIFVSTTTGENAIMAAPGAGGALSVEDVQAAAALIASASVFVAQLEQPASLVAKSVGMARAAGAVTILNPAPAAAGTDGALLKACDYLTPNEGEAAALTDCAVGSVDDAQAAARLLARRSGGKVIVTLGPQGAVFDDGIAAFHLPAIPVREVCDTTGAGDTFTGALAVGLAEGRGDLGAIRFALAAAALSVTRQGAALSAPNRSEIDALLLAGQLR